MRGAGNSSRKQPTSTSDWTFIPQYEPTASSNDLLTVVRSKAARASWARTGKRPNVGFGREFLLLKAEQISDVQNASETMPRLSHSRNILPKTAHGPQPCTATVPPAQVTPLHVRNCPIKQCKEDANEQKLEEVKVSYRLQENAGLFPIKMNSETYAIIQTLHGSLFNGVAAFRDYWFPLTIRDEAAFCQTLGMTLDFLGKIQGKPGLNPKSLAYQTLAFRSVARRLDKPNPETTDRLIEAVLMFLVHDHLFLNEARYRIHRRSLSYLIKQRGGIEKFDKEPNVRLLILWDEVKGAYAFGIRPEFPTPTTILQSPTPPPGQVLPLQLINTILELKHIDRPILADLVCNLYLLTAEIEWRGPAIWRDFRFLGFTVMNLIHPILSSNLDAIDDDSSTFFDNVERCWRLAAAIYVGDIRKRLMPNRHSKDHYLLSLKKYILQVYRLESWGVFENLKLWILYVGLCHDPDGSRGLFGEQIQGSFARLGLCTWDEVLETISSFSLYRADPEVDLDKIMRNTFTPPVYL